MSRAIKLICALLILAVLTQTVSAVDYYADVNIRVDEAGFVTITGQTNHHGFTVKDSENYTSKNREYWLLNITLPEQFSEYVYSLELPSTASINYVQSAGSFRIEDAAGKLIIKGFGQNKPFSVIVQYQLKKEPQSYVPFLLGSLAIVLVAIGIIYTALKTKPEKPNRKPAKRKKKTIRKEAITAANNMLTGLTQRQKQIIRILIKNKKPMTQAEIQKQLKLPKASVSRNIKTLELKGKVEKEKAGMTNIMKLKR